MQTLKRTIIILALLIPFSLISFYTNFPSLFSIQSAEAYTYQDVENAYNNAKAQYPNDYIFIEEFNQDGQKGYKVWRRPKNNLPYMTKYTYVGTAVNTTPQTYTYSGYINSCVGDRTKKIWKNSNEVFYKHISGELEYTYCDGSNVKAK